jgi:predicted RNA polymerase sigma factor
VRGRNAAGRADVCWLPVASGLTPHGLRHTHKTLMEEVGTPPKLMDERMGHEDGSVQALYSHITTAMRRQSLDGLTGRVTRAKQRIRDAGVRFELPPQPTRTGRLAVVLQVLYLMFNEGYTTSSGPGLHRTDLTAEAIRLTRLLHRLLPGEGEVTGLLALMLLTDARRAARTDADGSIVPLAQQHRELWDAAAIAEGTGLLTRTLGTVPVGPYQLQAAIAACHDEAPTDEQTDWPQILALYDVLAQVAPGPVVTLSRRGRHGHGARPHRRAGRARHPR